MPSSVPTNLPSSAPSSVPTSLPSSAPSSVPTYAPTTYTESQSKFERGICELLTYIFLFPSDVPLCSLAAATSPAAHGQFGWLCTGSLPPTPDQAICSWAGLVCDATGSVTSILLSGLGLTGSIPDNIGFLSTLSHIELNDNSLSGTVSSSLYNLLLLDYLDISRNAMVGTIASAFGTLSLLQYLAISSNSLTGTVPSSLCYIAGLTKLSFDGDRFRCYYGCLSSVISLNPGTIKPTCSYSKFDLT